MGVAADALPVPLLFVYHCSELPELAVADNGLALAFTQYTASDTIGADGLATIVALNTSLKLSQLLISI